jgi:hypothetical protein
MSNMQARSCNEELEEDRHAGGETETYAVEWEIE